MKWELLRNSWKMKLKKRLGVRIKGDKIVIYGHMTMNNKGAFSEIIPQKSVFMQFVVWEHPGICLYFSEEIKEKRKISVSLVKISKNGCRWKRVVV